jgi:hypothetical protein
MADEIDDQAADDPPPEWLSDAPVTDPDKFSLLRAIAEDEDSGLIELANGVWYSRSCARTATSCRDLPRHSTRLDDGPGRSMQ